MTQETVPDRCRPSLWPTRRSGLKQYTIFVDECLCHFSLLRICAEHTCRRKYTCKRIHTYIQTRECVVCVGGCVCVSLCVCVCVGVHTFVNINTHTQAHTQKSKNAHTTHHTNVFVYGCKYDIYRCASRCSDVC